MGVGDHFTTHQYQIAKTKKACNSLIYKGLQAWKIGRHDWTRTNDPYHVQAGNYTFMDVYG